MAVLIDTFAYHRLLLQADGSYELVLFLDFKSEIGKLPITEIAEKTSTLRVRIDSYIKRNLPGIKINSVRVMMGGVLITTLLLASPGTTADVYAPPDRIKPPLAADPINDLPPVNAPVPPTTTPDLGTTLSPPPTAPDADENIMHPAPNLGTNKVLVNKKYHLSSNYVPDNLTAPQVRFTFAEDLPQRYLQVEAANALEKLFNQAEREGVILYAVSGYRSYQRQADIFARNSVQNPEANRYSAKPGQSEHQTGMAMDVTNATLGALTQSFADTSEGLWLQAHAAQFGFIIRYPEGKEAITGYIYEPWHIRYVGVDAAQTIMDSGITLEEYLGLK